MVSISVGYLSEFSDKSATVTVYTVTQYILAKGKSSNKVVLVKYLPNGVSSTFPYCIFCG